MKRIKIDLVDTPYVFDITLVIECPYCKVIQEPIVTDIYHVTLTRYMGFSCTHCGKPFDIKIRHPKITMECVVSYWNDINDAPVEGIIKE